MLRSSSRLKLFFVSCLVPLAGTMAHVEMVNSAEPVQYLLRQLMILPTISEKHREEIHERATACLEQARAGKNFTSLARKYSEEPDADRTGGDLGYFGYREMVAPFSEAVFSMKPGDIAGPVETQYGYHIIKLLEIKGDMRHAQHILFMFEPNHEDSLRILSQLEEARRELLAGADFDSVILQYPTDPMLRKTRGRMVWQRPEEMLPSFAETVRGLGAGDISEPFVSILGFHIVQVDSINYDPNHLRSGFPPDIRVK